LLRVVMKLRNVQHIIYIIIFVLFANQAWSAEWVSYEKSTTGDEYYDQSSIKKAGNDIIRVRTKKIYNDVGKIRKYSVLKKLDKAPVNPYLLSHETVFFDIDCLHEKIKVSSERICDKRGGVVASDPQSNGEWRNIVPNSNFEKLRNKVCDPNKYSKMKKK
jgi:hypothetical protein